MKNVLINSLTVILGLILSVDAFSDTLYNPKNFDKEIYETKEIDVNFDGILDYVVYSKPFMGDELYFFVNRDKKYYLSLKGYNFSQDGGYIMTGIYPVLNKNNRLVIKTSFPGSGNSKINYFVFFKNNEYYLEKTIYTVGYSFDDDRRVDVCTVNQNIKLKKLYSNSSMHINQIPDESDRDDKCTISFDITVSIDDFIKRVDEEPYSKFETTQRYAALIKKYDITNKNVSQYNNLAYSLEKKEAYKEAIYLLNHIIDVYQSKAVAYINLGDAYWALEETNKAKDAYRTYIELMKKDGKESKISEQVLERVAR
ncbi:tetratricopeptide repeat protein [Vibrio gazogenes]|uniref:Uncharacterized protein n=1 Tax=Vibrio gazogenes TaxID=687 RepID=A0A1Z2SIN9_VIBGA|nr:tetratricopeptide repeat protein [Vibrio gazogenes]ASA56967.1 hypothetical protein BSQ33_15520 [Vibrio gazogenes]